MMESPMDESCYLLVDVNLKQIGREVLFTVEVIGF
jgi:hypothetical protein